MGRRLYISEPKLSALPPILHPLLQFFSGVILNFRGFFGVADSMRIVDTIAELFRSIWLSFFQDEMSKPSTKGSGRVARISTSLVVFPYLSKTPLISIPAPPGLVVPYIFFSGTSPPMEIS